MKQEDFVEKIETHGILSLFSYVKNGYLVFISSYKNSLAIELCIKRKDGKNIVKTSSESINSLDKILQQYTNGIPQNIKDKYWLGIACDSSHPITQIHSVR